MKKKSEERLGEGLIMAEVLLYAFFPVVANYTTRLMPPILFAGLSMMVAAAALLIYLIVRKDLSSIFHKRAFKYILGVAAFIIIIPSIFIYTGTSMTSSVNTTILLQTEIFFTFVIVGFFTHEKITMRKVVASLIITVGAIAVLFNGKIEVNWGDVLIIIGVASYPIGNVFAKTALKLTSSGAVLFIRCFLGGIFLILVSLIFEQYSDSVSFYIYENLGLLLFNGFVVYFVSKLFWYEGFKRMDISKSIPMAMSYPAFSLVYAYIFLKEVPNLYQLGGFVVIMVGIYVITMKKEKEAIVEID